MVDRGDIIKCNGAVPARSLSSSGAAAAASSIYRFSNSVPAAAQTLRRISEGPEKENKIRCIIIRVRRRRGKESKGLGIVTEIQLGKKREEEKFGFFLKKQLRLS
jgi:hypothetical protein